MITEIPLEERQERIKKIQHELNKRDLDAYLVHSTESDFANVLYLSNHWPVFETAGVIIPKKGEPILLIGPEAEPFAKSRSTIIKIRKLFEYRESAEPDYPGIPLSSFEEIFDEISEGRGIKKLGLGDYTILPMPVYDSLKRTLKKKETIIRAEEIVSNLRIIKSENEICLIKEAHKITEKVLDEILGKIKPGLTEKQVVGMVLESMYKNGAECEAFPQYVFSGNNTKNAISRSTFKKIEKNELIQLSIGARFGGYSSSIGRPLVIGKMPKKMKELVKFGLDAHLKTYEWIKEGILSSSIAEKFVRYYENNNYINYYLYGPCHGTGIIEVEKPWMETSSGYLLEENMTFMADTFIETPEYGIRWEDGFRVTKDGIEEFSNKWQELIEL
ncbi:MAG: Xaa-Pro peptidase family protein [Actinomycetota bacterium]|nr:Xaa-Pro peptidase family protein [Actinomycetota bacterium]